MSEQKELGTQVDRPQDRSCRIQIERYVCMSALVVVSIQWSTDVVAEINDNGDYLPVSILGCYTTHQYPNADIQCNSHLQRKRRASGQPGQADRVNPAVETF